MRNLLAGLTLTLLATSALAQTAQPMTPEQAIAGAAADPEHGVKGRFEFVVKGVGEVSTPQGRIVFLNSEQDYRAATNLSAQIMTSTVKALERQLGGPLSQTIIGKRIQVDGAARQTRISVAETGGGKPIGYYFQTRISVKGPEQLTLP